MDIGQATSAAAATTRSKSSQAPVKPGPGLSVRAAGNRMPLGEIMVNGKAGQETRRPQKSQGFTVFEDVDVKKSRGPQEAQIQDENSSQPLAQLPTFGGLRSAAAQSTSWPPPPQVPQSKTFWPAPPPIPTPQASLPFTIHEDNPDDDMNSRKTLPLPIGSERALSRSLNASTSSTADFPENLENLLPAIPSYARTEFRQSNDSILSTSPTSEAYDHSAADSEDSPMIVEGSNLVNAAPADILMDVSDYSLDIVAHTRRVEVKYLPKWNYMTKQPDITFTMRSILVDWLIEVAEEYRLHTETLFLAVNYIDRFLSFMSVQRAKLQLVGTACMFIAAKYEEIYPPDVSEFCYITDDTYTKKQVLRMEHLILEVLGFECSPPTAHFFANHFSKISGLADDNEAKFLAQYLVELTLLDGQTYLHFIPSIIGAAGVALARHTLGLSAWDAAMVEKTGLRVDDFKECLICLHKSFTDAHQYPQQAVRDKYKNEKYQMVSQLSPTPIF